jgi:hypothetical protein
MNGKVLRLPSRRFRTVPNEVRLVVANDNKRAGAHEVLVALEALRRLEAPADRIRWKVAEQRWRWAIAEINVVIESPAATRSEVDEAVRYLERWARYLGLYHPKIDQREKCLDHWLGLCERLEKENANGHPVSP